MKKKPKKSKKSKKSKKVPLHFFLRCAICFFHSGNEVPDRVCERAFCYILVSALGELEQRAKSDAARRALL